MSVSKPPLVPALRDLLAEERRALGDHPDVEEWMAFRAGLLGGGRAEALRDHLSVCRECADLVLDLAAFTGSKPSADTPPISDAQVKAASWQIRAALGDPHEHEPHEVEETRPAVGVHEIAPRRARRPSWRMSAGLIAASLLVVAGLTSWNLLRPAAASLQANVALTDETIELEAHEASPEAPGTQRGGGDRRRGDEESLSAGEEHSLGLPLPEGTFSFQGYRLEVLATDGGRVYESEALKLQSGMDKGLGEGFTLWVPKGGLPVGRYTTRLYGVDPGRSPDLIASYPFEITP